MQHSSYLRQKQLTLVWSNFMSEQQFGLPRLVGVSQCFSALFFVLHPAFVWQAGLSSSTAFHVRHALMASQCTFGSSSDGLGSAI